MATRFHDGQEIEALANAQGMKKGAFYTIMGHSELRTAFGNFVEYFLRPAGADHEEQELTVGNLHLLAREARALEADCVKCENEGRHEGEHVFCGAGVGR